MRAKKSEGFAFKQLGQELKTGSEAPEHEEGSSGEPRLRPGIDLILNNKQQIAALMSVVLVVVCATVVFSLRKQDIDSQSVQCEWEKGYLGKPEPDCESLYLWPEYCRPMDIKPEEASGLAGEFPGHFSVQPIIMRWQPEPQ